MSRCPSSSVWELDCVESAKNIFRDELAGGNERFVRGGHRRQTEVVLGRGSIEVDATTLLQAARNGRASVGRADSRRRGDEAGIVEGRQRASSLIDADGQISRSRSDVEGELDIAGREGAQELVNGGIDWGRAIRSRGDADVLR